MDERTRQLLESDPAPLIVKLATPNAVAFLIQGFVSMAEVWFISQLGTASLAAIALAFPLLMLTQMMSGGATGGAVTSAVARALGAGDLPRAERLIWHALAIAAIGAVVFLVVFLLVGETFLSFLGGSDDVLGNAVSYCLVLFSGGIAIWLLGVVGGIFRGMGDMKFPAMLMILSAFIQVPLSGVLVLGVFGAPQLGIVGAAISAVISGAVVSIVMLARLLMGPQSLKLHWYACSFSRGLFQDILKVALPASLSPFLTVASILGLTAIVGTFGASALAGYGIGSRIEFLLIPLVFGLGAAMTSLVGVSVGAGNTARAEKIGWIGSSMAAAIAGVTGLLLALLPELWISAFTVDTETFESAKSYIQIVGACYAFQGFGLSLYFASQGAGTVTWPVIATIVRIVLSVGGALLFAFVFEWGLEGVYFAAATAMVVYGVIIGASLKLGAWRR